MSWVKTTPGLCNDCQLTLESQLAEKAVATGSKKAEPSRSTLAADIEALNLPTITGSSQHQMEQATRLRQCQEDKITRSSRHKKNVAGGQFFCKIA